MQGVEENLASLFHENTCLAPYQVGIEMKDLPDQIDPDAAQWRFRLPAPAASRELTLEQAISHRSTVRSFEPLAVLPLEYLSAVLRLSCGPTGFGYATDGQPRRAAPSAGARYPIEVYAIARSVAMLPPGVYHFAPADHTFGLIRQGTFHSALSAWTLHQPYMSDTNVVLALVGKLQRVQERYGERGYRYMLLEAGHIAQNICLMAGAYGLGAVPSGGFVDLAIRRLIGGSDVGETMPLYLIGLGIPRFAAGGV